MALTSLVVCADAKAVQVLSQILLELGIHVEHCGDPSAAAARLAAQRFDAILLDCKDQQAAIGLIIAVRRMPVNRSSLILAMVDGRTQVRDMFSKGANFILYKPITAERTAGSLHVAKSLMRRERRRNLRIPLHAEASIAYSNTDNAPATLVDLCEDGTAIQAQNKLPASCKVYLQFSLPGQVTTIRLSGDIVWQDASGRVGIRFAGVPQTSRRVLTQWLKANLWRYIQAEQTVSEQTTSMAGLGFLSVSAADRREKSRHACRLGADVYRLGSTVPNRCSLSDISTGGCYVETTEPFRAGTAVEIVVRTQEMKLHVFGVVQAMHTGFGMGVRFSLKTADERDQVQQLVAYQRSEPGIPLEPGIR
jgi:CheY-like chemotaxis protein